MRVMLVGAFVVLGCGDRPAQLPGADPACPTQPRRIAQVDQGWMDTRFQSTLVDATHRYWIERPPWDENVLLRAPTDNPADVQEVARLPVTGSAVGVTVDPSGPFVYWTDDAGRVGRLVKNGDSDGGDQALLGETGPYDDDDYDPIVAVEGNSVFWVGGEPGRRADDEHRAGLYEICK